MKRLIILIDEKSWFLVSTPDCKNYMSMDVDKIKKNFLAFNFVVDVYKFSKLDLNEDFNGVYVLYQTSELPGSFFKGYIEDIIYFLEKNGAITIPSHEMLKAHHNKIFMELIRSRFKDDSLKTIKSICYGSWNEAQNYNGSFPVVIKQPSNAGSKGVFLARNRTEYKRVIRKASRIILASNLLDLVIIRTKKTVKKIIKYFNPLKAVYYSFNTDPLSTPIVVQNFIEGLQGDYKILIFGNKYYALYRKNRDSDFRASGSGRFFVVSENEHEGLFNFANKITRELDSPIFGMDVGFDGKNYHLFEFQMIHLGPCTLQNSQFWHEFHDNKWIRYEGTSDLEEEFSKAVYDYIIRSDKISN